MIDQPKAQSLAKQAFELWEAGESESAVPIYQEALLLADPQHHGLPDYHREFAGALSVLGRIAEAEEQYKLSLCVQLRQDGNEFTPGVIVARYFLAEHFLRQEEPVVALETIEPSLRDGVTMEWLLRLVKSCALNAVGHKEEARIEAILSIEKVPSDTKREQLSKYFAEKGIL